MAAEQTQARNVVIEWIDHILDRKKWTGTDLARKSELAPSTVLRMMNDPNHRFTPSLKTLQKISKGSGYPIPAKVTEALGAATEDDADASSDNAPRKREFSNHATARTKSQQIKVKYVSSLPATMHPVLKSDVSVACPPSLEGDDTAFAFYMPGSDLEPWFKAGSLMYASKRRDPYVGDMIIVTDKKGKSRVRLMVDTNELGLVVGKDMPVKRTETIKFDDIEDIAVIAAIDRL